MPHERRIYVNGTTPAINDTNLNALEKAVDELKDWLDPRDFGCVGNGSTDDTVNFQDALTEAASVRGVLISPPGLTYKISDTLTWGMCSVIGSWGNQSGTVEEFTKLLWAGPSGKPFIKKSVSSPQTNRGFSVFEGFIVSGGSTVGSRPNCGILYPATERVDALGWIRRCAIQSIDGHGISFLKGGINVWLQDFRFDGCLGYGINFVPTGNDQLFIRNLEVDNFGTRGAGEGDGGGAVFIDATAGDANVDVHCCIHGGKLEMGKNQLAGDGMIKIGVNINPASSPKKTQVHLSIDSVTCNPAAGVTCRGLQVTPAWSYVDVSIKNSRLFEINGIPEWNAYSMVGSDGFITSAEIRGHRPSANYGDPTVVSLAQILTDLNVTGVNYRWGKQLLDTIYLSDADASWASNPTNVLPGTWFFDPAQVNTSRRVIREVATEGTLGTNLGTGAVPVGDGVTGNIVNITNGADISFVRPGHQLHLTGPATLSNRVVSKVDYPNKIIYFNNAITVNTGYTLAFEPPSFLTHQLLVKVGSAPASGTWTQGDVVFNSSAAASGKVGWVCVTGGTPGTWKPFGAVDA